MMVKWFKDKKPPIDHQLLIKIESRYSDKYVVGTIDKEGNVVPSDDYNDHGVESIARWCYLIDVTG